MHLFEAFLESSGSTRLRQMTRSPPLIPYGEGETYHALSLERGSSIRLWLNVGRPPVPGELPHGKIPTQPGTTRSRFRTAAPGSACEGPASRLLGEDKRQVEFDRRRGGR